MDICIQFKRTALATAVCAALIAPQASVGNVLAPLVAIDAVEQQVNTSTMATYKPVVATDADGDFVVVWSTPLSINCVITARKFNADGSPATAEIAVSSSTTSCYTQPDVAMDADGDFVVAWTDFNANGASYFDVVAQRYDATGTAQGDLIQIAASTTSESNARVAMDADGDFAVAWREPTPVIFFPVIRLQRFDSSGVAQGTLQTVSSTSDMNPSEPDVAMDADGNIVAVWDESNTFLKGRLMPVDTAVSSEFIIASSTDARQPRVASDADGDFVVAWRNVDTSKLLVKGYDNTATETIPETWVANLDVAGLGDVSIDADGDFALSWGYWNNAVPPGVVESFIDRFDRTGSRISQSQFNVNVDGGESGSSIAMDADGDIVVAWEPDYDWTDGGDNNIYFRRFQGSEDVDLAISTSASPEPAPLGGSLTYTAIVSNHHFIVAGTSASQDLYFGEVGAATAVTLSDTLPSGSSYVSANGIGWSCSEANGTVSCSMDGSMPPSSLSYLDITVTTPSFITTLSNSATVAANQLDSIMSANNSDTLNTAMCSDYGTIALSAATAMFAEGGAPASLTVSRSGGSCGDVSVDYATADGTATAGEDYTATSGTLSWPAGDSTDKIITIDMNDDAMFEGDEEFILTLSNPRFATFGGASETTVTITENDINPALISGGGGGSTDPWWLALLSLPLLRRRRR